MRYVALLRGINLGARNKVAMADLRELVERLPGDDVTTYVQSGNVVFESKVAAGGLGATIEKEIKSELGLEVRVLVRKPAELEALVAKNPFVKQANDQKQLHVTFLAERPAAAKVKQLDPRHSEPDEFRVAGREVYLYCPNGYGRSKLSNAYFEKKLGVAATTRNWRTVTALAELATG
jgi:uncharacterized protein (DUF1697 family)